MQNKTMLIQIVSFLEYQGQIKVPTSIMQWDVFASDIEKRLPTLGAVYESFSSKGILPLLAIRSTEYHKNGDLWGILTSLVHHSISLIHERFDVHPLQSTHAFWQTKPNLLSAGGKEIWHSETHSAPTPFHQKREQEQNHKCLTAGW